MSSQLGTDYLHLGFDSKRECFGLVQNSWGLAKDGLSSSRNSI